MAMFNITVAQECGDGRQREAKRLTPELHQQADLEPQTSNDHILLQ